MKAGRELDALIAEKVMGLPAEWQEKLADWQIPRYSEYIEDAWLVVEKFRRGRYPHPKGHSVACVVELHITDYVMANDCSVTIYSPTQKKVRADAPAMELAICLAALKAVE